MTDETAHASREATGEANADSTEATEGREPKESDGQDDKRRHPRASLHILIQHRFSSLEEFISKYSSDLSMGGLFLRTDDPRAEGSLVYLQFSLKTGEKLIEGLGQVVRVNAPDNAEGLTPGMGIEFVNFDEQSLELIEQIVVERLHRHTSSPEA